MSRTNRGAGCLFKSANTGRFLLQRRSQGSSEPGTWGCWGGGSEINETPEQTLTREVAEEAQVALEGCPACPLLVFEHPDSGYVYHNFLVVVPDEFDPTTNEETEGWGWFPMGEMPDPLHFGVQALFDDPSSIAAIEGGYEGLSYLGEMNHSLYKYRHGRRKTRRTKPNLGEALSTLMESGVPFGFGVGQDGTAWGFVGEGFPDDLDNDRLDGCGDDLEETLDKLICAYAGGIRNVDIQLAEVLDEMSSTCGMAITTAHPPYEDEDDEDAV